MARDWISHQFCASHDTRNSAELNFIKSNLNYLVNFEKILMVTHSSNEPRRPIRHIKLDIYHYTFAGFKKDDSRKAETVSA